MSNYFFYLVSIKQKKSSDDDNSITTTIKTHKNRNIKKKRKLINVDVSQKNMLRTSNNDLTNRLYQLT